MGLKSDNVIRAVAPSTGAEEMVIGAEQTQYVEMVVGKYAAYPGSKHGVLGDPVPMILYRFAPSAEQRAEIAAGMDLFLAVMTFGRAPLPLQLQVGAGSFEQRELVDRP